MDRIETVEEQVNSRKERAKRLAVAGGETMFFAFCSTIGMLLATIMVESVRNRSGRES